MPDQRRDLPSARAKVMAWGSDPAATPDSTRDELDAPASPMVTSEDDFIRVLARCHSDALACMNEAVRMTADRGPMAAIEWIADFLNNTDGVDAEMAATMPEDWLTRWSSETTDQTVERLTLALREIVSLGESEGGSGWFVSLLAVNALASRPVPSPSEGGETP